MTVGTPEISTITPARKAHLPTPIFLGAGLIVILTLAVSFSLIYRNSVLLMKEENWVQHTHEVIAKIESLLSSMIDVETGQRGFVISGNESFLEPFQAGAQTAKPRLEELKQLVADNDQQRAALQELEPLIDRKISLSTEIIEARKKDGLLMAASLISDGEGKRVMDTIRKRVDQMLAEENRLLLLRSSRSREIAENSNLQFIVISLLNIFIIAVSLWVIYHNSKKRLEAEKSLALTKSNYEKEIQSATEASLAAHLATERANLLRDELLSNMYHELRTPLTSIVGFSEVLQSESTLDHQLKDLYSAIHRNSLHLAALVENLLKVAEMVREGNVPASESVALIPIIRDVIQRLQPAMDAKNIQMTLSADSENPFVAIHPERCKRALEQLIDNAIKFSAPNGRIQIDVGALDQKAVMTVIDEGIGIPKELMPNLFNAFKQGDGSISRTHGGLGMGLFVARFLIEAYGGTLTAESTGKNQGAKFVISLPLSNEKNRREILSQHPNA